MIEQLSASAFKSLRSITLEPKNVNLLIGANGTGKTNFADLIEFISLACRFGLEEAFNKRGGLDEVRTMQPSVGKRPRFSIDVRLGADPHRGIKAVHYRFSLLQSKSIEIEEEYLEATVLGRSSGKRASNERVKYDRKKEITLHFMRDRDCVTEWNIGGLEKPETFDDERNLILHAYGKLGAMQVVADYLSSMRVYNIDTALAKSATNGSEAELERSGGNLFAFLKREMKDEAVKRLLLDDLRYAVPYIHDITPEMIRSFTDLTFDEADSGLHLRAQQMSDGTVRLLGLLAVLRQSYPPPIIVIEEPENALHSYAVGTLLRIARSLSVSHEFPIQFFFTTHSPAVVDEVLKIESRSDAPTQGFVAKRKQGRGIIDIASPKTMNAIAKNLGRPSDFLRDGDFDDAPQIALSFNEE